MRTIPIGLLALSLYCLSVLACDGAGGNDVADDDDDTTEPVDCAEGFVFDGTLPDEFLETYPDRCVPEACGAGPWGDLELDETTVYVDVHHGSDADGDGSDEAPLATIQTGLNTAGNNGVTVAVAAGTYPEVLSLLSDHDGVHLAGRCPELVVVDASVGTSEDSGLLLNAVMANKEWTVSGLTITGANNGGVWLDGGNLTMIAVDVIGNTRHGIFGRYAGNTITLDHVNVRETLPLGNSHGRGLHIQTSISVEASHCVFEDNAEYGVYVSGATLELNSSRIDNNVEVGLFAIGPGVMVTLDTVEITGTMPASNGQCRGINMQDDGEFRATSSVIDGNCGMGMYASGEETLVVFTDTHVTNTVPDDAQGDARGVNVQGGARFEATGGTIAGNGSLGVFSTVAGTEVVLDGVEISGNGFDGRSTGGWGIEVHGDSTFEATSCTITDNNTLGLLVTGENTLAILTGGEVSDTQRLEDGTGGWGIQVSNGARLEATSTEVLGVAEIGIIGYDFNTELILDSVEIRDTRRGYPMEVAVGLVAQGGAVVDAQNCTVTGDQGIGLLAAAYGDLRCSQCELTANSFAGAVVWALGILDLPGSTISGTVPDGGAGGGIGVYAADHEGPATLFLDNTTIEDNPLCAVWIDGHGSYSITNSTITGGQGLERSYPDGSTEVYHGDGIVAINGTQLWDADASTGLLIDNNAIAGAYRTAILLDTSTATITSTNAFATNPTDLIWQRCDGTTEPDDLANVPVVDHCPVTNHDVMALVLELYVGDGIVEGYQ